VIFARDAGVPLPTAGDNGAWRITLAGEVGDWVPTRLAYYPLWRAESAGARLAKRRGEDGILEVRLTQSPQTVDLRYRAGAAEVLGVALSLAAIIAWAGTAWNAIR
jgi:hypothetical protein